MNWQTLAVLQTIPAACQLLMMRHVARGRKKYSAAVVNAISVVFLYLAGLVCLPFLGAPSLHETVASAGYIVLGAIMFCGAVVCMYRALEHLAAGIFSILQTSATLFTIALAVPLLHESFHHFQQVGAVILMLTIWATLFLANREDPHLEKTANWKKGVSYCLASSIFLAIALTNEKYLLSTISTSTYLVSEWGAQVLVAFAFAWWTAGAKEFRRLWQNQNARNWVLGSGVMRGLAAVLFIFAQVSSNNIAVVSVISNFKIIIIAIFGALVLKERKFFLHKMATASLAVSSLAMILKR